MAEKEIMLPHSIYIAEAKIGNKMHVVGSFSTAGSIDEVFWLCTVRHVPMDLHFTLRGFVVKYAQHEKKINVSSYFYSPLYNTVLTTQQCILETHTTVKQVVK